MELSLNPLNQSYSIDYSWSFCEILCYEGPKKHFNKCVEHFRHLQEEFSFSESLKCLGEFSITVIDAVPIIGHLAFIIEMIAVSCFKGISQGFGQQELASVRENFLIDESSPLLEEEAQSVEESLPLAKTISLNLIPKEPVKTTSYRPTYKKVEPNEDGRCFSYPYRFHFLDNISKDTTVDQFFLWCEEHPEYELHYGNGLGFNVLAIAASKGNIEVLAAVLEIAPELVDQQDYGHGRTPLFLACLANHVAAAKLLIEKGANVNMGVTLPFGLNANRLLVPKGATPLWMPTKNENEELVQLLLNSGAKLHFSRFKINGARVIINSDEDYKSMCSHYPPTMKPGYYGYDGQGVEFIFEQSVTFALKDSEKKRAVISVVSHKYNLPVELIQFIFSKYLDLFTKFW